MRTIRWTVLAALAALAAAAPAPARAGDEEAKPSATRAADTPGTPGIAWFGTLKEGLAEAKRTGRPVFLLAAAPQCHNVPGIW